MRPRGGLVSHTLAGAAATGWTALVTFALVPFLIRRLGIDGYGTWVLVTVLLVQGRGLASLLDLGVQQSLIRRIAATSDDEVAARSLGAGLAVVTVTGTLAAAVVVAAAPAMVRVAGVGESVRPDAVLAVRLVGIQLLVDLVAVVGGSALEGRRRYAARRSMDVLRITSFGVACLILVPAGAGPSSVARASLVSSIATLVVTAWVLAAVGLVPRRGGSVRGELGEAVPLLALRATGVGFRQLDKVVLGIVVGAVAVGGFDVAEKINLVPMTLLGVLTSALIPAAAVAVRRASGPGPLAVRSTTWCALLVVPLSGMIVGLAGPLTQLTAGTAVTGAPAAVRWLALTTAIACSYAASFEAAIGLGAGRRLAPIALAELTLNLVATVVLARWFGLAGSAAASALTALVVAPILLRVLGEVVGAPVGALVRATVPGVVVAVPATLLTWFAVGSGRDASSLVRGVPLGLVGVAVGVGLTLLLRRRFPVPSPRDLEAA